MNQEIEEQIEAARAEGYAEGEQAGYLKGEEAGREKGYAEGLEAAGAIRKPGTLDGEAMQEVMNSRPLTQAEKRRKDQAEMNARTLRDALAKDIRKERTTVKPN